MMFRSQITTSGANKHSAMYLFYHAAIVLLVLFSPRGPEHRGSSISVASAERLNDYRHRGRHRGRHRTLKHSQSSSDEDSLKTTDISSSSLSKKSISGKGGSKKSKKGSSKSSSKSGTPAPVPSHVVVDITDYFIAYSVPGLEEPTSATIEQLRTQTEQYWTEFFLEFFASTNAGLVPGYSEHIRFSGVDLEIVDTKYGQDNPPEYLDFYAEYDMKLLYELGTTNPPDVGQSFDIMRYQSDVYTRYVSDFVRSIPTFSQTDFIFFDAVDPVTIPPVPTLAPPTDLVEIPIPEFSLGYNVPGLLSEPSPFQLQQLVDTTHNFLVDDTLFRLPFGYFLYEVQLASTSAVFGGIPEEYNYYVTLDAIFILSRESWAEDPVPSPEDVFDLIETADSASYILNYVRNIQDFETTQSVVLERSEPPPTFEQKVPPHYVAYEVPGLTTEPSLIELQELADATHNFWNSFFVDLFAGSGVLFLEVQLFPNRAFLNADIPAPSYNYWVAWDASIIFDGQGSEPPDPTELLQIMVSANLDAYLFEYVKQLLTFADTNDVVIGTFEGVTSDNTVQLDDMFIAYYVEDLAVDPFPEEIEELVALTTQFFHSHLTKHFQDFEIEGYVNVGIILIDAGIRDDDLDGFNFEIRFNVVISFAPGFLVPDARTAFEALVFYADMERYRREYVLSIDAFQLTRYLSLEKTKELFEIQVPGFTFTYDVPGLQEPTSIQLQQLVDTTGIFLLSDTSFRLGPGYTTTDVQLTSTDAGNPNDLSFNYFVTYEAVFVVASEFATEDPVPTSDDILELISTADFASYILYYVRNIEGFERTRKVGFESTVSPSVFKVIVPAHYIAYSAPGLTAEPSPDDLQDLEDATRNFWNAFFAAYFGGSTVAFLEVELSAVQAVYGASIPDTVYNQWVAWDVSILADGQGTEPPDPMELLQIMANADLSSYVSDYVSPIQAFESTNDATLQDLKGVITENAVRLDDLYIAYNIVDLFAPPPAEDVDRLLEVTREFFHKQLTQYFLFFGLGGYINTELTLLESGLDDVPQPDSFNFVVRFNAVVSFAPGYPAPDMRELFETLAFTDFGPYRRQLALIDSFTLTDFLFLGRAMDDNAMLRLDGLYFALSVPGLVSGPTESEAHQLVDALRVFWANQLSGLLAGEVFLNVDLSLVDWGLDRKDLNPNPSVYNFLVEFDMIIGSAPDSSVLPDPESLLPILLDMASSTTLIPDYIAHVPTFRRTIEAFFNARNLPYLVKNGTSKEKEVDKTLVPTESSKMMSLEELLKKSSSAKPVASKNDSGN